MFIDEKIFLGIRENRIHLFTQLIRESQYYQAKVIVHSPSRFEITLSQSVAKLNFYQYIHQWIVTYYTLISLNATSILTLILRICYQNVYNWCSCCII